MSTHDDPVLAEILEPRKGLSVVPVQDELVLYDRSGGGRLHRLDHRAALVWRLLDGTSTVGQTAAEIAAALGADPATVARDVAELVRHLYDQNLVVSTGSAGGRPRRRDPRRATGHDEDDAPDGEPAPSPGGVVPVARTPCSASLDAEGWHATDAVRADAFVVGIRTGEEAGRDALLGRFGPLLEHGSAVDANFSLRAALARTSSRPARLAQLYAGCSLVGRHRTTDEALTALARELQATAAVATDDRPWFQGSVLLVRGRAVLAPGWLWPAWTTIAARLRRRGVIPFARHVRLDTISGEAVLPALEGPLRAAVAEDSPLLVEQRLPIHAWLLPGQPPAARPAPAQAVALAASSVINLDRIGLERLLPDLEALASKIELRFAPSEAAAVVDLAEGLVGRASG